MSWRKILPLFSLLFFFFFSSLLHAFSEADVPEALKPWIAWVMLGHEEEKCPQIQGENECLWPSGLHLKLEAKGGSFAQSWKVMKEAWVFLPGDKDHWPQNVKSNGEPISVLSREESPAVYLKPGLYNLSGTYQWDDLPENFSIPPETGPLKLWVLGKEISFPRREADGSLWLEQEVRENKGEEHLELRVNRKMEDEIPFILVTEIHLDVSGKSREVVLGKVLPAGFIPMALSGALPARLDEQGQLRIQVKAGQWTVNLEARHEGPVTEIQWSPPAAPWPSEEIWVFQANNNLRMVNIEGLPTVDPQQTLLPEEWKKLPAYQVSEGSTLQFVEKRRGDSDPAPDQLSLNRQWWLDFDGKGFTIRDDMSGDLRRSWRLEANPPMQLGRVAVNNEDQLITRLPESDRDGVEIRQGSLKLTADSRIEGAYRSLSAVGWNQSFQKVSATLNLPPGWRLFAVTGVDQAPSTWVNLWSLLDIFVVLIVSLAFLKLTSRRWGLLALITLVLTYKEVDAPQWIWLFLLVGVALLKYLPEGRFKKIVRIYRFVCVLVLVGWSIPFMIFQMRIALYPSLENPYQILENATLPNTNVDNYKDDIQNQAGAVAPLVAPTPTSEEAEGRVKEEAKVMPKGKMAPQYRPQEFVKSDAVEQASGGAGNVTSYRKMAYSKNLLEQRPGTKIQTGPGLPKWIWEQASLNWSGPVSKDQKICLLLIPPWLNVFLAFARVALLAFFILGLLKFPGNFWPTKIKGRWAMGLASVVLALLVWGSPQTLRAEYPPENLLNELRERLLAKPECDPDCASISRMNLEVQGNVLRARLEVNALVDTSIPIPGSQKEWLPSSVSMDGQSFAGVNNSDEGSLWLQVPAGVHQVLIEGALPEQESVSLALPLKPYFVSASLQGWTLEGLHENGSADDTLRLLRSQSAESQPGKVDSKGNNGNVFPPLVRLERRIELGLTWMVHNTITRVGPPGAAAILEIPLLEGESVTSNDIRVNQNKVSVTLAPTATELSWESVLAESPKIHLQAPQTNAWLETWQLEASAVWHVTWQGIPVIFNQQTQGAWVPEWMPWPGESVEIEISRPEAVAGQTLTLQESTLDVTPGLRFTDVKLSLTLRSSLGGQHTFVLPEGAEVQSLSINQQNQAIRQEGRNLTLPLLPGLQSFVIQWQQPGGVGFFFKSPEVNVGISSVNSEVQLHLSNNRWILFVCGPRMGPAVLIWSLLIILALASIALGKSRFTPLKIHEWILLGIGMFQFPEAPVLATLFVMGWFLALSWRKNKTQMNELLFNLRQLALWFWAFLAIIFLFVAISQGLIGYPDMQITGNGSYTDLLRWFQDRSSSLLPQPWVISLPLYVYRIAMLAWALWLAWAFMRWIKWAWICMGEGGYWRKMKNVVKKTEMPKGEA